MRDRRSGRTSYCRCGQAHSRGADAAPTLRPLVAWAAIVVLVVLAVIRSAVATRTDGFTIDDAYHITAGAS